MDNSPQSPDLPWDALASAAAYPEDATAADGVECVQTHISRVFLTRDRVYKFRKAVALSFLDFSSQAARNTDCLEEVRLNRRLAPDVYLGVAPLLVDAGRATVGPISETLRAADLEHCVVMRRLPAGRDALSLLTAGRLPWNALDAVAERLAGFHRGVALAREVLPGRADWLDGIERPVQACVDVLAESGLPGLGPGLGQRLERAVRERTAALAGAFERRRQEGRAVDGHGDLHLDHVWFEREDTVPLVIDCVEFDRALREIDPASDVAFLAMDLRYRGEALRAERFLRLYARGTDDFGLYDVVDYFAAYRGAVRAKVAALAAIDPGIAEAQRERAAHSATEHAALAEELLREPGVGPVVALCGTVGSGKSSVAAELADRIGGVVIASDEVRRSAPLATPRAAERYTDERVDAVYRAMLERAAPVVESGRPVLLDATHSVRLRRDRVAAWARERGARAWLVEAHCERGEAHGRLVRRASTGEDASEAGPERLDASLAAFEPPSEWPSETRVRVATTEGWQDRIEPLVGKLAG